MHKRLSILVCTHRRPQGLSELLRTLAPQIADHGDREVIVVNDGTHDADYEQVVREFGDLMQYDVLPRSLGIAAARNRTAALASGTYLVFTDDDCVAPPHWLDWLDARLRTQPELDVVAGTTRPRDLDAANLVGRTQAAFQLLPRPHSHEGGMWSFVTACLAVRADLFRSLDGFRALGTFAIAGEDTDLSFRMARHHARIKVDDQWWVEHVLARSVRAEFRRFYRYGYSNGAQLMSDNPPRQFDYHLKRLHLTWFGAVRAHLNYNRVRAKDLELQGLRSFAYRLTAALIQAGLDEGAKAAIIKLRGEKGIAKVMGSK